MTQQEAAQLIATIRDSLGIVEGYSLAILTNYENEIGNLPGFREPLTEALNRAREATSDLMEVVPPVELVLNPQGQEIDELDVLSS